jgi:hypothetical protein
MIFKLSSADKGRRVKAYITDGVKPTEYREGTFVGIADNGLPLIKYDIFSIARVAQPEWLVWAEDEPSES